jgi:hypothetical protein
MLRHCSAEKLATFRTPDFAQLGGFTQGKAKAQRVAHCAYLPYRLELKNYFVSR